MKNKKTDIKQALETGVLKVKINELSDLILENSGVHRDYSDEDLSNALIIFQEVFSSKMWDKHKGKITGKQLVMLSHEAGKSMHQTVEIYTGVDLHKIYG